MNKFDKEEDIVKAKVVKQIGILFDKYLRSENSKGEELFKVIGISSFYDDYIADGWNTQQDKINPYWYNKGFRNDNLSYDYRFVLNDLLNRFQEAYIGGDIIDKDYQYLLFNEIIKGSKGSDIEEIIDESTQNGLSLLGYKLTYENNKYDLELISSSNIIKENNLTILEDVLRKKNKDIYDKFREAKKLFINLDYRSCIATLRVIIETIFGKEDGINLDYKKVLELTNEMAEEFKNKAKIERKDLYNGTNNKLNRSKLVSSLWGVTSGFGAHAGEDPTKEDAFMILNMMEDFLIWFYVGNNFYSE